MRIVSDEATKKLIGSPWQKTTVLSIAKTFCKQLENRINLRIEIGKLYHKIETQFILLSHGNIDSKNSILMVSRWS
jgi:hypothetical protein